MYCLRPLILALGIVPLAAPAELSSLWTTDAVFEAPECVLFDHTQEIFYVSNIAGSPGERDGKGYISKLGLDGTVIEQEWISGLDAPKGMAISQGRLYVADIDTVVEIDLRAGEVVRRHEAPGAKFLNDVAADAAGNVYVSDTGDNTIYRLAGGHLEVWLRSDALESPNGLLVEDTRLIIGSWGVSEEPSGTPQPGHLKYVILGEQHVGTLGNGQPVGNLDGVEADGRRGYFVTDWIGGKLFRVGRDGSATKLLELGRGSADLEVLPDRGLVLIPLMLEGKVAAYRLAR